VPDCGHGPTTAAPGSRSPGSGPDGTVDLGRSRARCACASGRRRPPGQSGTAVLPRTMPSSVISKPSADATRRARPCRPTSCSAVIALRRPAVRWPCGGGIVKGAPGDVDAPETGVDPRRRNADLVVDRASRQQVRFVVVEVLGVGGDMAQPGSEATLRVDFECEIMGATTPLRRDSVQGGIDP
jgi:hypothetical protein